MDSGRCKKWNQFPDAKLECMTLSLKTPTKKSASRIRLASISRFLLISSIIFLYLNISNATETPNQDAMKAPNDSVEKMPNQNDANSAFYPDENNHHHLSASQDLASQDLVSQDLASHEDLSSLASSPYHFTSRSRRCGNKFASHLASEFGHRFASSANDVPFIVQITLENKLGVIKSKCVGVLITHVWILTSADCGIDAITDANNELSFKVTHFDLDFDHWSSGVAKLKNANNNETPMKETPIRQTLNVTDIHLTSISKTCAPMLLRLEAPLKLSSNIEDNSVCLPPSVSIRNEWKGIASGWSTYGESVIERYLRVTQVSVRNQHCLSDANLNQDANLNAINGDARKRLSDEDAIFCVSYLPQVHFYLLPGSPLLTIHEDAIILMGVACSNLSSNLINSSYIYSQTYSRVSSYLDLITSTIDTDGKANELISDSGIVSTFQNFILIFSLFLTLGLNQHSF